MPDLDLFTRYIRESANELEAAIQKRQSEKPKKAKKKVEKAASDPLFDKLAAFLQKQPAGEAPKGGVFHFAVTGDVPTDWTIDLRTNPGSVKKGKPDNADAAFTVADEHLVKITEGKLDVQTAFIQGRLKIDGDFSQAMRLGKILGKMMKG
jgi:alkyl sulfatase BDS1-like metallo-beta-lactamase superfamily hydrolase